ncbi:MAG: hypothetical protein K0R63_373 [Rickettsiales bacterium]|jgi:hypothetical protein|nr:hypothetical protein [Rickettsiales bacterium]
MLTFIKRSLKGEENFWKVFWIWIVGGNTPGVVIFSDYLSSFLKVGDSLAVVLPFWLIYLPFSLYLGSKADEKGPWGRFLIVMLWISFILLFLLLMASLVFYCMLGRAGGATQCFYGLISWE